MVYAPSSKMTAISKYFRFFFVFVFFFLNLCLLDHITKDYFPVNDAAGVGLSYKDTKNECGVLCIVSTIMKTYFLSKQLLIFSFRSWLCSL